MERVLPGKAVIISMLVVIALIAGLICYVLYYRLDKSSSYIVGMLPMIIDACVMSVFLGILATS
ncbi:MAG: hypothetical protein HGA22_02910 [Clostridiales bacterium]|nr:hypothetical protein [Clostridiales bacterium]